jgi:hypothetical protein
MMQQEKTAKYVSQRIVDFLKVNLEKSTAFLYSLSAYANGRKFCVTNKGHMGRVPYGSSIGDKVCIFFGGCVPFVLRECGDGTFRLVGECYIYGIMDGEAMKREDIANLSRDFDIR